MRKLTVLLVVTGMLLLSVALVEAQYYTLYCQGSDYSKVTVGTTALVTQSLRLHQYGSTESVQVGYPLTPGSEVLIVQGPACQIKDSFTYTMWRVSYKGSGFDRTGWIAESEKGTRFIEPVINLGITTISYKSLGTNQASPWPWMNTHVNVRSYPQVPEGDYLSNVIPKAKISPDEVVYILGRNLSGTWIKIYRYDTGTTGWVCTNLMQTGVIVNDLPVVDSTSYYCNQSNRW